MVLLCWFRNVEKLIYTFIIHTHEFEEEFFVTQRFDKRYRMLKMRELFFPALEDQLIYLLD